MTPATPASPEARSLSCLLDRAAIHDLHARYFRSLDQCNPAGVRSCLTDDVKAKYEGRPLVSGADAVVGSLSHHFARLRSGELKVSSHFMGNLDYVRIEGDAAETETYVVSFLVRPARPGEKEAGGDRIAMRGLRYIDRLRRSGGGWLICERVHTLDWACEEAARSSRLFAERVMGLPAR